MKLAEALLLRADMQKKIESLRERIAKNTLVQQGEKPSEDPKALLKSVETMTADLRRLVVAINLANVGAKTARNRTLTEALADRDALVLLHSIVQGAAASAAKSPERHGVKEIRWVKTVDVPALQKQADELAKSIREVNGEIQAANWEVDVKEK